MKEQLKKFTYLLVFIVCGFPAHAQENNRTITGKVIEQNGKPLEFANATLMAQNDSSIVQGVVTDSIGVFAFKQIKEGDYIVSITFVGYQKSQSKSVTIKGETHQVNLEPFQLTLDENLLKEIMVEAKKPLFERHTDKVVMNVSGSAIASGSSLLDLVKRAPGVVVTQNKISMNGKSGIRVMMDGREQHISGQELFSELENTNSNGVHSIEIISRPSAKYAAEGAGGIINIISNRAFSKGISGSAYVGMGRGNKTKFNSGFNLNYKVGKVMTHMIYSYVWNPRTRENNVSRTFADNANTLFFNQNNFQLQESNLHRIRGGLDYYINKKNTLSFSFDGKVYQKETTYNTETDFLNSAHVIDSSSLTNSFRDRQKNVWSYSVNYQHKYKKKGAKLSLDLAHTTFDYDIPTSYTTKFYGEDKSVFIRDLIEKGENPTTTGINTLKIDFTYPIGKAVTVEVGAKASMVSTDTKVDFFVSEAGQFETDDRRTNAFNYDENINAAYVMLTKEIGKVEVQAGLRVEHTITKGESITTKKKTEISYTDLFPSVHVSYDLDKNNQFYISYSRRLNRAKYKDLNPFVYYIDPFSSIQGNQHLTPEYANSIDATYTHKRKYSATLFYSRTDGAIEQVSTQNNDTKQILYRRENLDYFYEYGAEISLPFEVAKFWEVTLNVDVFNNKYETLIQDKMLDNSKTYYKVAVFNDFAIAKGFTAELTGYYLSGFSQNIYTGGDMYEVSVGFRKSLFKNKWNLKVSLSDIFNTMQVSSFTKFNNQDTRMDIKDDTRVLSATLTYKFKKGQKAKKRRWRSSDREEKRRAD